MQKLNNFSSKIQIFSLKPYYDTASKQYPAVTITGPRQSGKTTLCKQIFKDKPYVSFENLDVRRLAINDPNYFLSQFPKGAILDEIQQAPDLLSYIQTIVDEKNKEGLFILTGSQQFELMHKISQSLAGRTALVNLLPFSYSEIYSDIKNIDLDKILYTGFYPRIFDKKLNPTQAMAFYVGTYLERDIRNLLNIKDMSKFEIFLRLCAGRTGQILNLSSLANDAGITHVTAKSWLSILETSCIIFFVRPYFKNFNKRLVKSPKLYFTDVGLASYLLGIEKKEHIKYHPLRGTLFETFAVDELLKARYNKVKANNLYYFRDNIGNEVDVILDYGNKVIPIEIKSGATISEGWLKALNYYHKLDQARIEDMYVLYSGTLETKTKQICFRNFRNIKMIVE